MVLHSSTKKAAERANVPAEKVERLTSSIENVLDEKGLDPDVIVPYSDMNGPITDKESVDYETHQGVNEAFRYLDSVSETGVAMLSGWDNSTLDHVASEKLGMEIDIVGELGAVARISGELHSTVEGIDDSEIVDFRRQAWLEAASRGMTLQEQGNVSSVTGCMYGEGARSDLYQSPIAERSRQDFSMESLTEYLEGRQEVKDSSYSSQGDAIIIDLSYDEAARALSDALTTEHPLVGIKWEDAEGAEAVKITENSFGQSDLPDEQYLEEFQDFMDDVAEGTCFETDHNPDFSTDFQRNDISVSKEHGAEYRAEEVTEDGADYVMINMGDKPGDILYGQQTVTVGQKGMPSEQELEEMDMPHATAETAADYALAVGELIQRRLE